jgi:hypothetical protein
MARLGSFDICAYAPTWFDVNSDVGGWVDRDYIPMPTGPGPIPWYSSLLYTGGWEEESAMDPLDAGVSWELGLGPYEDGVSFQAFEQKILEAQQDETRRDEFRQMAKVFGEEHAEKMKLVRRAVTIAGVTYVVWRLIMWL